MTKPYPWDEIQSPNSDYNVRLLENASVIPMFWGKDKDGLCLFIIELEGEHSRLFRKSRISIRGISVDLRTLNSPDKQNLVLTLEQHINRDLFFGLCRTLATNLQDVSDSSAATSITLEHLNRWRNFLASKKPRLLSIEDVRGLFAELQFLRHLYQFRLTQIAAVQAWCGPDGAHQDFIFGNTAVEIKAMSGNERQTVRISSEDQLSSAVDNLFLKIFRLSDLPTSPHATSLNQLVRLIENELLDSTATELLVSKLTAFGYVEMDEYENPKLTVTSQKAYRVHDTFPRIIRSNISPGLTRVKYEIKLECIAHFECDDSRIWKEV